MFIRDLTHASGPREIVMDEPRPRYGTTRMREASGVIVPARVADPREPNIRGPWHVVDDSLKGRDPQPRPFDILRSSPTAPRREAPRRERGRALGARVYDARIDAYVAVPKPPLPTPKAPPPTPEVRDEHVGDFYWVVCRVTGMRMRRFRAMTPDRAQQIAAEYSLNTGGGAADAYALKED